MDILNFLKEWFSQDLAALGTVLITTIALFIFSLDISSRVKKREYLKAFALFIAYLITVLGLLLIIYQSFKVFHLNN